MTCYMRHMNWLFDELGLASDKKNRALIDGAIREVLGLGADAECPQIWGAIKGLSEDDRFDLAPQIAEILEARS